MRQLNKAGWCNMSGRAVRNLSVILLTAVLLTACTTVPQTRDKGRHDHVAKRLGCSFYQEGIASWYGERFRGRKTANGERFNPDHMTAAHKKLPFGTVIRVIRADGEFDTDGVELRVNDRGPFIKGRIVDVSTIAAKKLNMKGEGVAPVRLYVCS
jgi:rare lipoprotein A